MKQVVQIRPEQARYISAMKAKADAAQAVYMTALNASLAGLVPQSTHVEGFDDDGNVTIIVPDVPKEG